MRHILLLGLLLWPCLALAQSTPPAPTCEQTVETQVRSLVTDKLLADPPGATWAQQLTALTSALRIQRTQYDLKEQQAKFAEQQAATLYEHLRQSQQREAALKQELEALRQPASPTPAN
jgi:hypothetical protein